MTLPPAEVSMLRTVASRPPPRVSSLQRRLLPAFPRRVFLMGSVLGISHDWHSHRNPFETCWKLDLGNNNDHQYCWSKSYYKSAKVGGWWQCVPNGRGWYALERVETIPSRPVIKTGTTPNTAGHNRTLATCLPIRMSNTSRMVVSGIP